MTEFEQWLKDNEIEKCPYMGGYQTFGKSITELVREGKPLHDYRQEAIARFSFAILDGATIQRLLPHGPFLEIGCGTGYWSHELRKAGADAVATDPEPYSTVNTTPATHYPPIDRVDFGSAIRSYSYGRTLLMVWPDYEGEWSADALELYAGRKVVLVSEGNGGCVGCDRLFKILEKSWEVVEEIVIPQWSGIHDRLEIYQRKGV